MQEELKLSSFLLSSEVLFSDLHLEHFPSFIFTDEYCFWIGSWSFGGGADRSQLNSFQFFPFLDSNSIECRNS